LRPKSSLPDRVMIDSTHLKAHRTAASLLKKGAVPQMSDHKGAALMLDALPPAKTLLGDRGYDAGWFRNAWPHASSSRAFPQSPIVKYRSLTTAHSTISGTRSRTCSQGSKTGDAWRER
jgi:hypothetical protein